MINSIKVKGSNQQLNLNKKNIESDRDDISKKENTESNLKENKDGDKAEEVQQQEMKNQNGNQPQVKTKEKKPIIAYQIDSSYQNKLIPALGKNSKIRPQFLLEPDYDDIREKIEKLDKKEEDDDKLNEQMDLKADKREKEAKEFLNRYKTSTFSGKTLLQDPIALFSAAQKAYIDQFYKLSDLFVICPLYYNYRISLEYCISESENDKKNEAYHLFNTKEISPVCSHNFCPNQCREIDINIFNFVVDSEDRKIQHFISIKKPCRCGISCFCACCSRPTFIVESPIEALGKIVEIFSTCDPILKIYDINDDEIYTISTSCCNCGYCLRDGCCGSRKCASCEFSIFSKKENKVTGLIVKDHRSGKKTKPDYDQLVVTFPQNISCQDKILIMCSSLVLEYLYFQNLSNSRRCNGNPKFMNTFN